MSMAGPDARRVPDTGRCRSIAPMELLLTVTILIAVIGAVASLAGVDSRPLDAPGRYRLTD